jgi:hypothetical protein
MRHRPPTFYRPAPAWQLLCRLLCLAWLLPTLSGLAGCGQGAPGPTASTQALLQVSQNSAAAIGLLSNADNPSAQPGTVAIDSEVEPTLAVNPTNPLNVVVAYQQDRWDNGGSRALVAAVSFDGGASFVFVAIPQLTQAADGPFQRASDPRLAFGPNGDLYCASLLFTGDLRTRTVARNAMAVSKSINGGLSWGRPVILFDQPDPVGLFDDRESIAVDPNSAGTSYVIWDRIKWTDPQRNGGPAVFTRSTSAGLAYDGPREITNYGDSQQTVGNQIVVMPNGSLVNFFALTVTQPGPSLPANPAMARAIGSVIFSTDRGQSWSAPGQVAVLYSRSTLTPNGVGIRDPQDGAALRAPGFLPAVAFNPANGALYMVWQDTRFVNPVPQLTPDQVSPDLLIDEIAFAQSLDGGLTWSAPIKINRTPTDIPLLNRQAFLPSIAVAANGTVAVTYYDFRNNTSPPALGADYFVVFYRSGGGPITDQASWSHELRLTDATFDVRKAVRSQEEGNRGGFVLGDRMGLAASGSDFLSAFVQTTATDPGSVFFRRFRLEGAGGQVSFCPTNVNC